MNRGLLFLVLVFSVPIVSSLSTPITVPVIVKLGNDKAINTVAGNLKNHFSNSIELLYGTVQYYFIIWRSFYITIWIGHGEKAGVHILDNFLSWNIFNILSRITPSQDLVISCHATSLLHHKGIIPIGNSYIDALVATNIALYVLTKEPKYLEQAINESMKILTGRRDPILLGHLIMKMGPNEVFWAAVGIFFFALGILAARWLAEALRDEIKVAVSTAINRGLISQIVAMIMLFIGLFTKKVSFYAFVADFIPTFLTLLYFLIMAIPWWKSWSIAVLAGLQTQAWVKIISTASLILGLISLAICIGSDLIDDDDKATTFWG